MGLVLSAVSLFLLTRHVGWASARRIVGAAYRGYAGTLAEALARFNPVRDVPGAALYRVVAFTVVLDRELTAELGVERARTILQAMIVGMALKVGRIAMGRLPRGESAFAVFKKRLDRSNRRLTLLQWETRDDTAETYRVVFSACGIAQIAARMGAPHVAQQFCAFDEAFFKGFDPRLTLERPGTIARGHSVCDFRYHWQEPR
jgi:hypothetical protein